MTIVDTQGNKLQLPRLGMDNFWNDVFLKYARENQRRWKYLAMLALQESADWTLEQIGQAFCHNRGHVYRCLEQVKRDLRNHFSDGRQPPSDSSEATMAAEEFDDAEPPPRRPHRAVRRSAGRKV